MSEADNRTGSQTQEDPQPVGTHLLSDDVQAALFALAEIVQSATAEERYVAHRVLSELGKKSADLDRIFDALVGLELAIDGQMRELIARPAGAL